MSELKAADMAEARRGFRRCLRRKGFSWHFINGHGEDLFAQAQLEVLQVLAKGAHVYHPPGWLIHCAWYRTINLLDKQSRRPEEVTVEKAAPLESEEPGPEKELLAAESHDRLLQVMQHLLPAQREIIELIYLQDLSCREASFSLGWSSSKADRCHHAALGRLRPFFEAGLLQA